MGIKCVIVVASAPVHQFTDLVIYNSYMYNLSSISPSLISW